MRFLHIADLHFGKTMGGFSLIDSKDQTEWVERFLVKADELKADAVVIAGDVYDRSNPGADAVKLFDHLITELNRRDIPVMAVSGNHDSGDRLSFAETLLERQGFHVAGEVKREIRKVTLTDEYGPVNFYLLPYFFPAIVSQVLEDDSVRDYDTAARRIVEAQDLDLTQRNVLLSHQNVLANGVSPERSGSETMVGGVGEIDYTAFDAFDYVALGHIHAGQSMGRETVRYAGSPLCYHFQELRHPDKGCLLITMGEKGSVEVGKIAIEPVHPLAVIEGTHRQILEQIERIDRPSYLCVVLEDDRLTREITQSIEAVSRLKRCEVLEFDRKITGSQAAAGTLTAQEMRSQSMDELFLRFCREQYGSEPDAEDMRLILSAMEQIGSPARTGIHWESDKEAAAIARLALEQEGKA